MSEANTHLASPHIIIKNLFLHCKSSHFLQKITNLPESQVDQILSQLQLTNDDLLYFENRLQAKFNKITKTQREISGQKQVRRLYAILYEALHIFIQNGFQTELKNLIKLLSSLTNRIPWENSPDLVKPLYEIFEHFESESQNDYNFIVSTFCQDLSLSVTKNLLEVMKETDGYILQEFLLQNIIKRSENVYDIIHSRIRLAEVLLAQRRNFKNEDPYALLTSVTEPIYDLLSHAQKKHSEQKLDNCNTKQTESDESNFNGTYLDCNI